MKINKEMIDSLLSLDDESLWREIRRIAARYGINLTEATPSGEELAELRRVASGDKMPSLGEAVRILQKLGRGK